MDARYDDESRAARAALAALEDVYRLRGSIPFSAPDTPGQLAAADAELATRQDAVRAAATRAAPLSDRGRVVATNLEKLAAVLEFARRDLHIQERRTLGATPAEVKGMVTELVTFLHRFEGEGLFLTRTPDDDLTRLTKHYTTESRVAVPAGGAG